MKKNKLLLDTKKFFRALLEADVSFINLIVIGNSLSDGYSMNNPTIPLMFRDPYITELAKQYNIPINFFNFSRSENNNDEKLMQNLISNISLEELNTFKRIDYTKSPTTAPVFRESPLFPLNSILKVDKNINFRNLLFESSNNPNLIFINCATGNIVNAANHKYIKINFKKEIMDLYSFFLSIHNFNRLYGTNLQIYCAGIPNYLGIGVSSLLVNHELKKICKMFPNVVYVPSAVCKMIYFTNGIKVDVHYSDYEYIQLLCNFLESVSKNFSAIKAQIVLDREWYHKSNSIESKERHLISNDELLQEFIEKTLENVSSLRKEFYSFVKMDATNSYAWLGYKNIKKILKRHM